MPGGGDVPGTMSYLSFPGFSTTTKREGAPTVPPISTTSSWLVPTAWITRRREFHTPSCFLSFVCRPAARGGRGRRGMTTTCSSSFPGFFISRQGGWKGRGQRRTRSLSPGVLDGDKGAGWHICAPLIPTHGVVDRAGVKPTRRPCLNWFPPHRGGLCLQRHKERGAVCKPHAVPIPVYLPPQQGGILFFSYGSLMGPA